MNLKSFMAWCTARGIQTPLEIRVQHHHDCDGGGVSRYTVLHDDKAIRPQQPQDDKVTILQCPLSACMIESSMTKLAKRLVQERALGTESLYAPYIAMLPSVASASTRRSEEEQCQLPDLPRFWSMERLESTTLFDGGFLYQAVQDQKMQRTATGEYDADDSSLLLDCWARAIVDSRAHYLPNDRGYALTPVFDMINHNAHVPTSASILKNGDDPEAEDDVFCLFISRARQEEQQQQHSSSSFLEKGKGVCISYGDLTNLQTLLNYGFLQPDNPHNRESVRLNIMGMGSMVIQILAGKNDNGIGNNSMVDSVALSTLRKFLAQGDEMAMMTESSSSTSSFGADGPLLVPVLSRRNEVEVQALLAGFVQESASKARAGAAANQKDALVPVYLTERAKTLERVLTGIEQKFPEVFG